MARELRDVWRIWRGGDREDIKRAAERLFAMLDEIEKP